MTSKVAVVLIFFRRRCALEVLQAIRRYAPERLFLVADGGRTPEEHAQSLAVRESVEAAIDWPCRVERLYSDRNLGCRGNIPRGITWAFSHVDRAIILEDDMVPHPDFFPFCEEMLERYAEDTRVMTVSGTNHFPGHPNFGRFSYLFSGYAITWGYATWARAWHHYDADMRFWPAAKEGGLLSSGFLTPRERSFWLQVFDEIWSRTCTYDPYDFQWLFASWVQCGLSIVPRSNLVTNIGSGPEATHTRQADCKFLRRPTQAIGWPLKHPLIVVRNAAFDPELGRFVWYGDARPAWQKHLANHLPSGICNALRSLRRSGRSRLTQLRRSITGARSR